MNICVCERDCSSGSDQNLGIIDFGKLVAIAADENHEDKDLAQEWINALNLISENIKKEGHPYGVDYECPSSYSPDGAKVKDFPVEIAFCCEVFCNE